MVRFECLGIITIAQEARGLLFMMLVESLYSLMEIQVVSI